MFEADLAMRTMNVSVCHDMLNFWTQVEDFNDLDSLKASHVRCMFDLPSVKCMGDQFVGSADKVVQVGAGQAVEDGSHYDEGLEQEDHFDMRVVDAFLAC